MADLIIDQLINIPLFDNLKGDDLTTIAPYMNMSQAKKGDVIFVEGDKGDYICFVVVGALKVVKATGGGGEVTLSTLPKGRSIGEMSVIDDYPRSATVIADQDSSMVILPRSGFEQILEQHPVIGVKLLMGLTRLLSLNLRKTSSRLADYMLPLG